MSVRLDREIAIMKSQLYDCLNKNCKNGDISADMDEELKSMNGCQDKESVFSSDESTDRLSNTY